MEMDSKKISETIRTTERSMKHSFDKIFKELEKSYCGKKTKVKCQPKNIIHRKPKRDTISGEKELKKALARNWKRTEELNNKQLENRRNVDRVLRKHSRTIIKKWQSELIQTKHMADQLQKDSEKLASVLRSTTDISRRESRVARLHHHFRNSQRYVKKIHKQELRETYEELREVGAAVKE